MRALVAGNWKMNPATLAEARALAAAIRDGAGQAEAGQGSADLLICPPFTALAAVADILRGSPIALGAQDCHPDPAGAHTGDISAAMLRDIGVTHVILGHSERRSDHGEFDDIIRRKTVAAMHAGLIPIVCVGETQDQRLSGQECEVVGWQLEGSLPRDFDGVIAYEPVWAIGTGRTATEADVQTMHAFIAEELRRQFGEKSRAWPILYGGSVRPANARALLHLPNVAGALVGGASLTAEAFLAIARKE